MRLVARRCGEKAEKGHKDGNENKRRICPPQKKERKKKSFVASVLQRC